MSYTAFGDREAVTIQSKSAPVITFGQGSSGAFLGHLTVKVCHYLTGNIKKPTRLRELDKCWPSKTKKHKGIKYNHYTEFLFVGFG